MVAEEDLLQHTEWLREMGSFAPEHGYQELVDLYQARYAYLRQKYEATSDLEMVHTADQQTTPVDRPILGLIALQKRTGGLLRDLLPATILYCDSGLGSPILDLLHVYANASEDDTNSRSSTRK